MLLELMMHDDGHAIGFNCRQRGTRYDSQKLIRPFNALHTALHTTLHTALHTALHTTLHTALHT